MTIKQPVFNFPYARIAFGSVGAGYSTVATLEPVAISTSLPPAGGVAILNFQNSLNQDVILSFDNGTTDSVYLLAGKDYSLDLGAADLSYTGVVRIKHAGVAPTSGAIVLTAVFSRI